MLRKNAGEKVRTILDDPNVDVVPQTRKSFLRGLEFYASRLDKEYSLTDCISMNTMKEKGLGEVLTGDTHFKSEGYTILI